MTESKIKIAIVDVIGLCFDGQTTEKYGLGGSESAVCYMAKELAALGFEVTVYNNCIDSRATPGTYDGVEYVDLGDDSIISRKCDVLISSRTVIPFLHEKHPAQTHPTDPQRFDSLRKDAKWKVLWMHDTFSPGLNNHQGDHLVEELVVRGVIDEIFTLSDFHTAYVTNCDHGKRRNFEVLKTKIFQTRNGIKRRIQDVDIQAKDPNLFVYNASATKGLVPLFEKIWPKIKRQLPQARLSVIGGFYRFRDGAEPDAQENIVQNMAQKSALSSTLGTTFHGVIPQQEVAEIVARASYMIYPGAFPETFGISTLESLNYNTPLITTRFGALEETAINHASFMIDYAIEPNSLFQTIDTNAQIDKFVETVVYAAGTKDGRYLSQQKMQYCNIVRDISEWDTVALQWKQHLYKKLGQYLSVEEYRKVSRINEKVHRVFGRRFSNIEEWTTHRTSEQPIRVVVPYFNAGKYIIQCLESILAQDYDTYEVLLIDDASTDNGRKVVDAYLQTLPDHLQLKVKHKTNKKNKGAVFNQVRAIRENTTKDNMIIMLIDGDDSLVNDNEIFQRYNTFYQDNAAEFTYGSSWSMADNIPLVAQPYPESVKKDKSYRKHRFAWGMPYTHLRAFRRSIIDTVDIGNSCFKNENDEWYRAGGDNAIFYELLERADPAKVFALQDIVYNYNDLNPLNDYKVNAEEQTKTATAIQGPAPMVPETLDMGQHMLPVVTPKPAKMKNILLAVPDKGHIETETFLSIWNLIVPEGYNLVFKPFYGYGVEQVRNLIAYSAVLNKFDYLFAVDSDIELPRDALVKLLAHDKDIISGLYIQKNDREIPEIFGPTPQGGVKQVSIESLRPAGLYQVPAVGFGCVLVKVEVLEKMPYKHFEYHQWSAAPEDKNNIVSEDVSFCQNADALGYQIWVDSSIVCGHWGKTCFKPEEEKKEPIKVTTTFTPEQKRLIELSEQRLLPLPHQHYLYKLRNTMKVNPRVIYDIGACVLHWTTVAREVWGNAHFVVFDAMQASEFLFQRAGLDYACATLGSENNVERDFWENTEHPGGNSFYAENPAYSIGATTIFTPDKLVKKKVYTLDFIVDHFKFPTPNLCKMDVQGAEMEILKGAQKTLANCEHLILELQTVDYNKGAPKAPEVIEYVESIGFELVTPRFSANTNDGDYHFKRG